MSEEEEPFKVLKEEKIFKAFNHLRKLVGAPDPIDFN